MAEDQREKDMKKLIALLAALALIAAACGSDDDSASEETSEETTSSEESEGEEEEETTTTEAVAAPEGGVAGEGGNLLLLQWQAPSQANSLLSNGTKDLQAGSLVLESLAEYTPQGEIVPALATEIPTTANGGISEDLTTITWTLRDDVLWSDGTPFTSDDVVFTYEYCSDEATGCSVLGFNAVTSVVADDDFTVTVTFEAPTPYPFNRTLATGARSSSEPSSLIVSAKRRRAVLIRTSLRSVPGRTWSPSFARKTRSPTR